MLPAHVLRTRELLPRARGATTPHAWATSSCQPLLQPTRSSGLESAQASGGSDQPTRTQATSTRRGRQGAWRARGNGDAAPRPHPAPSPCPHGGTVTPRSPHAALCSLQARAGLCSPVPRPGLLRLVQDVGRGLPRREPAGPPALKQGAASGKARQAAGRGSQGPWHLCDPGKCCRRKARAGGTEQGQAHASARAATTPLLCWQQARCALRWDGTGGLRAAQTGPRGPASAQAHITNRLSFRGPPRPRVHSLPCWGKGPSGGQMGRETAPPCGPDAAGGLPAPRTAPQTPQTSQQAPTSRGRLRLPPQTAPQGPGTHCCPPLAAPPTPALLALLSFSPPSPL